MPPQHDKGRWLQGTFLQNKTLKKSGVVSNGFLEKKYKILIKYKLGNHLMINRYSLLCATSG